MRKYIFLVLLLSLFSIGSLSALDSTHVHKTAQYYIRAYKMTDADISLNIYGTVPNQLRRLGQDSSYLQQLDISEKLRNILHESDPSNSNEIIMPDFGNNSAFSVHVSGNTDAKVNVEVAATAFSKVNDSDGEISIIPCWYQFGERESEFNFYSASESSGKIEPDEIDFAAAYADENSEAKLSFSFSVYNTANRVDKLWFARRSVGLAIDKEAFDSAPIGSYKATVKVTITPEIINNGGKE